MAGRESLRAEKVPNIVYLTGQDCGDMLKSFRVCASYHDIQATASSTHQSMNRQTNSKMGAWTGKSAVIFPIVPVRALQIGIFEWLKLRLRCAIQ